MLNHRVRTLTGAALAAAIALLLSGCGLLPFGSQSASELAKNSLLAWEKGSAYQFKGSLSLSEGPLHVNVTESQDGSQADGSGTLGGRPFSYRAANSNAYLKGQSFWQAYYQGHSDEQTEARGFEEKWVNDPGTDVTSALHELIDLGGDLDHLSTDADSFKKGATRTIDGQQATALRYGGDTFWVTQGNPDQLVGFRAATAGSLSQVDVTMAQVKVPNVSAPSGSETVDPSDSSTLPALYNVVDADGDNGTCDPTTCPVEADIENEGGAPQGTSTVQITAQDLNTNANIASCTATIPSIAPGADAEVPCTITGAAWSAWANAQPDGDTFFNIVAQVTANPPYVG